MTTKRTCFTAGEKEIEAKKRLGVTWRYLINKGIYYCDEIVRKEEFLLDNYKNATKSNTHALMIEHIRHHHPEVYNEALSVRFK